MKPRHNKGCNCRRSSCLKNYCECYEVSHAAPGPGSRQVSVWAQVTFAVKKKNFFFTVIKNETRFSFLPPKVSVMRAHKCAQFLEYQLCFSSQANEPGAPLGAGGLPEPTLWVSGGGRPPPGPACPEEPRPGRAVCPGRALIARSGQRALATRQSWDTAVQTAFLMESVARFSRISVAVEGIVVSPFLPPFRSPFSVLEDREGEEGAHRSQQQRSQEALP